MNLTNQELLECIAPYLPYSLKWQLLGQERLLTMTGLTKETLYTEEGAVLNWCPKKEFALHLHPILRPLSDLNKPCLEGGIIPLEDLKEEIGFGWCDAYSDALEVLEDNAHYTRLSELMIRMPYEFINYFISHHFDVFGLIQQGYAIDINTLKDGN